MVGRDGAKGRLHSMVPKRRRLDSDDSCHNGAGLPHRRLEVSFARFDLTCCILEGRLVIIIPPHACGRSELRVWDGGAESSMNPAFI